VTSRHRWQRWLGWCALLLGCAQDNDDGCSEVDDCPPPCLVAEVEIELVTDPSDPLLDTDFPGSGTWHMDIELDGERFGCSWRLGEPDCPDTSLQLLGTHLLLDRGPSSLELTVRYVDLDGGETVVLREELEPSYALPSEDPICGACPVALLEVEVPVELIAEGE
jgi:hypothetical protein